MRKIKLKMFGIMGVLLLVMAIPILFTCYLVNFLAQVTQEYLLKAIDYIFEKSEDEDEQ